MVVGYWTSPLEANHLIVAVVGLLGFVCPFGKLVLVLCCRDCIANLTPPVEMNDFASVIVFGV